MLGLVLIYFIGKYFHDLAKKYGKNGWPYAIIGVVSYYAGTFIGGIIIGILWALIGTTSITADDELLVGLMSFPFGVLICWGTYSLFKYNWSKIKIVDRSDILDSGLM